MRTYKRILTSNKDHGKPSWLNENCPECWRVCTKVLKWVETCLRNWFLTTGLPGKSHYTHFAIDFFRLFPPSHWCVSCIISTCIFIIKTEWSSTAHIFPTFSLRVYCKTLCMFGMVLSCFNHIWVLRPHEL